MIKRNNNNKEKNYLRNYAKYSGLAFEMLGIIFLGTFAGKKIDEKTTSDFPIWTLILSIFSIGVALYVVIRSVLNNK